MKQFLLPENGKFYRANLHCHTVISDGKKTPEEIKEIYKSHGYSVVAYTDHNVQVAHPELRDPDFLPLNGVEYNINNFGYPGKNREVKTCHLCFIATREDIKYAVCYTDSYVKHGAARDYIDVSMRNPDEPDYPRIYSPECINDMIKKGRKAGYFVTYNHPDWSQERFPDYTRYHGMNAMEIANYGCIKSGFDSYCSREYDDMLRNGERIFCIGADDNHNKIDVGEPGCDSLGAWTMIKAEKLEYDTIGQALLDGHCYASMGPEIKALWYENGTVHVETSDAVSISMIYGVKFAQKVDARQGETVNTADFKLRNKSKWFRIRVIDKEGKPADSHAYFLDELDLSDMEQA